MINYNFNLAKKMKYCNLVNEINEATKNEFTDKKLSFSLATAVLYAQQFHRKLSFGFVIIEGTHLFDKNKMLIEQIKSDATYVEIKKHIQENTRLNQIDQEYFTNDDNINNLVDIDSKSYHCNAQIFICKNLTSLPRPFPLSFSKFVYYALSSYMPQLKMDDLSIEIYYSDWGNPYLKFNLYDESITFIQHNNFIDYYSVKNCIQKMINNCDERNDAIQLFNIQCNNTKKYLKNIIGNYFIDEVDSFSSVICKLHSVIEFADYTEDVQISYREKITSGYIQINFEREIILCESAKFVENTNNLVDNLIGQLKGSEIVIGEHVVRFDNKVELKYDLSIDSTIKQTKIVGNYKFIFGIYPIKQYYAPGGIGYYKSRLDNRRADNNLTEFYHEVFPDKEISTTMYEELNNWILNLTTRDYNEQ